MFVRKKIINGKPKFYLVENTRQDGKVRQKVLAYLGDNDTVEGAISWNERMAAAARARIERDTQAASKLEAIHKEMYLKLKERNGFPWKLLPPDGSIPPYEGRASSQGERLYWQHKASIEKDKKHIQEYDIQLAKLRSYCSA